MSRTKLIDLLPTAPHILPSMLMCDFANLADEVRQLEVADIHVLHLDVMDGNFVPNLTYGMPIVSAIRGVTDLLLDVHLMIERPERYFSSFAEAGADVLTVHVEGLTDVSAALREIRELGIAAGLALNPQTPLEDVLPYLEECDLLLVMSVEPGFGGQAFNPVALEKLQKLKQTKPDRLLLEVDGGVNTRTVAQCSGSGADLLVIGSAIFQQDDYGRAVQEIHRLIS